MVSWFDSHIYGFLTLHNQSSWFIKDPLSHLSPPLLSCWDPWWWSGCCNQPFAISKSMVADWEVQWENERFHRTSPALLFCRSYLIIVADAADAVSVNFSGRCKFFTDLTRKIGYLLCKLAIYCVNFGVNFIFQKLCQCKKNDNYQVCARGPTIHMRKDMTCTET